MHDALSQVEALLAADPTNEEALQVQVFMVRSRIPRFLAIILSLVFVPRSMLS